MKFSTTTVYASAVAVAYSQVSQIGDGQIQAPTYTSYAAPITQIGDGQIQAPTSVYIPPAVITSIYQSVVSQISDAQPQVPGPSSAPPVTTAVYVPPPVVTSTSVPVVITSIAPSVVSQISDAQPQVPGPSTVAPPVTTAVYVPPTTIAPPVTLSTSISVVVPPASNGTTYTSAPPVPTSVVNSAGALKVSGLLAGVVAVAAFFL